MDQEENPQTDQARWVRSIDVRGDEKDFAGWVPRTKYLYFLSPYKLSAMFGEAGTPCRSIDSLRLSSTFLIMGVIRNIILHHCLHISVFRMSVDCQVCSGGFLSINSSKASYSYHESHVVHGI